MPSLSTMWSIEATRLTSFSNQGQISHDVDDWIKSITGQDVIASKRTPVSLNTTGALDEQIYVDFALVPQRTDWVFRPKPTPVAIESLANIASLAECLNRYVQYLERLDGWLPTVRLALGFSLVLKVESMHEAQKQWVELLGKTISGGLASSDLFYRINKPITLKDDLVINRLCTYQTCLISLIKAPQNPQEAAYNITPEDSSIVCRIDADINTDARKALNLDTKSQVKLLGQLIKTALSVVK